MQIGFIMEKRKYGQIEEFEYTYTREHSVREMIYNKLKLYRVSIITEYTIFGKVFKKKFIVPFVFEKKETAKEFLQYDIKYKMVRLRLYALGYWTSIQACLLKFNGLSCYATFYQDNTVKTSKTDIKDYPMYEHDMNIRIFKDLKLFPRGIDPVYPRSLVDWDDKHSYLDVTKPYFDGKSGKNLAWNTIKDFIIYTQDTTNDDKKLKEEQAKEQEENCKIISISTYELVKK